MDAKGRNHGHHEYERTLLTLLFLGGSGGWKGESWYYSQCFHCPASLLATFRGKDFPIVNKVSESNQNVLAIEMGINDQCPIAYLDL